MMDRLVNIINNSLQVNESGTTRWKALRQHFQIKILNPFIQHLTKTIYIPDFRTIKESHNTKSPTDSLINGSNIISQIHEMQHPEVGEEYKNDLLREIQKTAKELIGIEDLILEVPSKKDKIIVKTNNQRLSLESFGTGIHQIILISCALIANPNHIVLN